MKLINETNELDTFTFYISEESEIDNNHPGLGGLKFKITTNIGILRPGYIVSPVATNYRGPGLVIQNRPTVGPKGYTYEVIVRSRDVSEYLPKEYLKKNTIFMCKYSNPLDIPHYDIWLYDYIKWDEL